MKQNESNSDARISQLVGRFLADETSVAEERELASLLRSAEHLPEELKAVAALLCGNFPTTEADELLRNEEAAYAELLAKQGAVRSRSRVVVLRWVGSIVGAAAVVLLGFFLMPRQAEVPAGNHDAVKIAAVRNVPVPKPESAVAVPEPESETVVQAKPEPAVVKSAPAVKKPVPAELPDEEAEDETSDELYEQVDEYFDRRFEEVQAMSDLLEYRNEQLFRKVALQSAYEARKSLLTDVHEIEVKEPKNI